MPSFVPLLLAIALVIAAAKLGGWLSSRFGQPQVLGELIAGLLLGPSVLNLFGLAYFEEAHVGNVLRELGELGVIFLMFAAGLEIHLSDFARMGKPAMFTGVSGVLFPIAFGFAAALPFGYTVEQAIFLGIVLAATSVSISAQTLMELGVLRNREGLILLASAVVDDVLAVAILSAFVAITTSGSSAAASIVWTIARILLFLVGASWLSWWLLPRLATWMASLRISEPVVSFAVVSVLLLAWASETIGGVAAITGAFVAGVALSASAYKLEIEEGIHTLNYAFFVPLFLVGIGLTANARLLSPNDIGFTVLISAVAVISKLIGAGLGARFSGTTWAEALRIGVGMISRGEVGLIVAAVGVSNGIIAADIFTVVVIMVLVTTLITPPLLRWTFHAKESTNGRIDRLGIERPE
jgi:Kef-type K+ transport system membrane component KefB